MRIFELTKRARRRTILLAVGMLMLAGVTSGIASLLRPNPHMHLVEAWMLGSPSQWSLRQTAANRDRQALRELPLFAQMHSAPVNTPSEFQWKEHLAGINRIGSTDVLAVYLSAGARLNSRNQVELLVAGADAEEFLRLDEILDRIRRAPAGRKLLVLDLAEVDRDPWCVGNGQLIEQVIRELKRDDSHLLTLLACGPGESSLISQSWRRTAFGHFFEAGILGQADGWTNGETDARISAHELAAYVIHHVRHWARVVHNRPQTPRLIGNAEDIDLATISWRGSKSHFQSQTEAEATDYPKWLAEAWTKKNALVADGALQLRPRLIHRWEQSLLRAESQWRGGRDAAAVQQDLQFEINRLEEENRKSSEMLAPLPPFSLEMLDRRNFEEHLQPTTKALTALLSHVDQAAQSQPPEKFQQTRQALLAAFQQKLVKVPDDAMATAALDCLAALPSPSHSDVVLLDEVVSSRQSQPAYVETLLLRRLAELSGDSQTDWPAAGVLQAFRVGQACIAAADSEHGFSWNRPQLDQAWQAAHDGRYLLLRPGYAPARRISSAFERSKRSSRVALSQQQTLELAHEILARAMFRLPYFLMHSSRHPFQQETCPIAVTETCKLATLLNRDAGRSESAGAVEQIRLQALKVQPLLEELTRPYRQTAVARLLARAERESATAGELNRLTHLLNWPEFDADTRARLVSAVESLSGRLHVQAQQTQPRLKEFLRESFPDPEPNNQLPTNGTVGSIQTALQLLRLAGMSEAKAGPLQEKVSNSKSDAAPLVRAAFSELTSAAKESENWGRRKSIGWILPADRNVSWLDNIEQNPWLQSRLETLGQKRKWLAAQFAYQSHDDTPTLYAEVARRLDPAAAAATPFLRFAGDETIGRPTSDDRTASAEVRWNRIGGDSVESSGSDSVSILLPDPSFRVTSHPVKSLSGMGVGLELSQPSSAVDPQAALGGLIVRVAQLGRVWHRPVKFVLPLDESSLDVALTSQPDSSSPAADSLRLRPSPMPQTRYLRIANRSDEAANLAIDVPGIGAAKVELAAGQARIVPLKPAPAAAKTPALLPDGQLSVMVRDAGTSQLLLSRRIRIDVLSPVQYVRTLATRYSPEENAAGTLSVTLQADAMPPGPPCPVRLDLRAERVPGLQAISGGSLGGTLPLDGTPLVLSARPIIRGGADSRGRFFLTVDGVEEAICWESRFPTRGDPITPCQDLQPKITLTAPQYVLSSGGFQPVCGAKQAALDAALSLQIGKDGAAGFRAEREETKQQPQFQKVQAKVAKDGGVELLASRENWMFSFDTTGLVGKRILQATLLDPEGRQVASRRTVVVFDDSPPETVAFDDAPGEVLVKKPISLDVRAGDSVSAIDKVLVFLGKPVDGKLPEGAKPVEAKRSERDATFRVVLPAEKQVGSIDVTAQAINSVGLCSFSTIRVDVVETLSTESGAIRGRVVEGGRPQPRLKVTLKNEQGKEVATATSEAQGAFLFRALKPGKYTLTTAKEASGRSAETTVKVRAGAAAQVALELTL